MALGTSKKTELKLIGVDRASLRELSLWPKGHPQVLDIRALAYKSDKSYSTYKTYKGHHNVL